MKKHTRPKKTTSKATPAKAAASALSPARAANLRRKNRNLGIALGLFAFMLAISVFVWRFTHPVAEVTITQPGE